MEKKVIMGDTLVGFIEISPFVCMENYSQKVSQGIGLSALFGEQSQTKQLETFITFSIQEFPRLKLVQSLFPPNFIISSQDELIGLKYKSLPKHIDSEKSWFELS